MAHQALKGETSDGRKLDAVARGRDALASGPTAAITSIPNMWLSLAVERPRKLKSQSGTPSCGGLAKSTSLALVAIHRRLGVERGTEEPFSLMPYKLLGRDCLGAHEVVLC